MVAGVITVHLPWPDKALSPNSRSRWPAIRAKGIARRAAWALTLEAIGWPMGKARKPQKGPLSVSLTFHPPDARRRDLDNCLASCKAQIDGIADALGVNDSLWQIRLSMGEPLRPHGEVVVTVEAL